MYFIENSHNSHFIEKLYAAESWNISDLVGVWNNRSVYKKSWSAQEPVQLLYDNLACHKNLLLQWSRQRALPP